MLAIAAAAIFAVLGFLHLLYTFDDDWRSPRHFPPRDKALLEAMKQTKLALAPHGHDFWATLVGFHYSHSIGVLLVALLIVVASLYDIAWLRLILIGVGTAYTVIAWRYWFHIPLIGVLTATLLLVAAWAF